MKNDFEVFYTYVLKCSDNSFYTGYTNDLKSRINKHNKKIGSKYTRARTPVKYILIKACPSKNKAMSYEKRIKLLKRKQKEKIISGDNLDFWLN